MKRTFQLLSMAAAIFALSSCAESQTADQDLTLKQIIEKYYLDRDFTLGASSKDTYLTTDTTLMRIWKNEFHYNTPENDTKQVVVYPTPGAEWNDHNYMEYIKIARENGQVMRFHSPTSPQSSAYICDDSRTPEELEPMLREFVGRMFTVIEENSDVVKWADVVNETLAGSDITGSGYNGEHSTDAVTYKTGDWFGPRVGDNQWENPWTKLGFETVTFEGVTFDIPKYIPMAFKIAQEKAPSVKFIFNQDGNEVDLELWNTLYRTIRYMRSQGLRIDGVAYQCHVYLGWEKKPENLEKLQTIMTQAHENDLEFLISELDVITDGEIEDYQGEARLKIRDEQAATIGAVVELVLQNVGKGVTSLNFWTMTDNRWIPGKTCCTLFEPNGEPCAAYHTVKDLLLKYAK